MKQTIILALLGLALSIPCASALGQEPRPRRWSDQAELAFVNTTGNSEVLTIAVKNILDYKLTPRLTGNWKIGALKGKTQGETTAERYYSDLRFDYTFTDHFYTYLLGGWLQDRFAGFDQRYYLGPGAGYHFYSGPYSFLRCEAGLNYAYEDYVTGENEDFLEGRLFGKYEYAFSDKNRFFFSVEFLQDFNDGENYKARGETAVIAGLTDVLALKIGYEVRYQNRPTPADLEKTDTILGASFIITY